MSATRGPAKYDLVAADLRRRLGALAAHDALPAERELMKEYAVSRMTIRHAVRQLVDAGLVYQVQGSGTFVAPPEVVTKTLTLTSFTEDMQQRGLAAASEVLATRRGEIDPADAAELGVPATTQVVALTRLRTADGAPMALERARFLADVADFDRIDLSRSIYAQLAEQGVHIVRAAQVIDAVNLDARAARILDQAVGAAAIRVTRTSYTSRGQAVERAETLYRGDRYSFDLVVSREHR